MTCCRSRSSASLAGPPPISARTSRCCSTSSPSSGSGGSRRADRIEAESLGFHERVRDVVPRAGRGRPRALPRRRRPARPRTTIAASVRERLAPVLPLADAATTRRPVGGSTHERLGRPGRTGRRCRQLEGAVSGCRRGAARRVAATGMTHAWLFTGPPGSGRSNAARAFAAALLCERRRLRRVPGLPHGAGRLARRRHASSSPSSPSSGSTRCASCVRQAALAPAGRRWQIDDRSRTPTGSTTRPPTRCSRASRSRRRAPSGCCAHRRSRTSCRRSGRAAAPLVLRTPPTAAVAALPAEPRRRRRAGGRLRRPRVAGTHRPGAGARARRGHPQPAARGAPRSPAS